jgi:hypothetical protein
MNILEFIVQTQLKPFLDNLCSQMYPAENVTALQFPIQQSSDRIKTDFVNQRYLKFRTV